MAKDYDSAFNSANYVHQMSKEEQRRKRKGDRANKKHLVELSKEGYGAYYRTSFRDKTRKPVFVRYYKPQGLSKFFKRYCSKCVRHSDVVGSGRGGYKKVVNMEYLID